MNRLQFQCLASLARLEAEYLTLRHASLISPYRPRLPLKGVLVKQKGRLVACCYLWTFTLKNPRTATLEELAQSWTALMHNRKRLCPEFKALRSFEKSPRQRWHVHAVAVRFCDVRKIRRLAQRFGFGRVNVKLIPVGKALYVVKYVTKNRRSSDAKGCRLYACVGFVGQKDSDIVEYNGYREWIYSLTPHMETRGERFWPWNQREDSALTLWMQSLNQGRIRKQNMYKLNQNQQVQVAACFDRGEIPFPGEYRGTKVTHGQFGSFEDPDIKVWKVTVTHAFEGINGGQIVLVEYLPQAEDEADALKQVAAAEKNVAWKTGDKLIAKLSTLQKAKGMRKGAVEGFERLVP